MYSCWNINSYSNIVGLKAHTSSRVFLQTALIRPVVLTTIVAVNVN